MRLLRRVGDCSSCRRDETKMPVPLTPISPTSLTSRSPQPSTPRFGLVARSTNDRQMTEATVRLEVEVGRPDAGRIPCLILGDRQEFDQSLDDLAVGMTDLAAPEAADLLGAVDTVAGEQADRRAELVVIQTSGPRGVIDQLREVPIHTGALLLCLVRECPPGSTTWLSVRQP